MVKIISSGSKLDSRNVDATVLKCIQEELRSFGAGIDTVFFWVLARDYDLAMEKIPKFPEKFVQALNESFGNYIGPVIEVSIVKRIRASLNLRIGEKESIADTKEDLVSLLKLLSVKK
ncbi:MAG: NitrOD5 domain-containing protein [Nitrososphaerales archaeon]